MAAQSTNEHEQDLKETTHLSQSLPLARTLNRFLLILLRWLLKKSLVCVETLLLPSSVVV